MRRWILGLSATALALASGCFGRTKPVADYMAWDTNYDRDTGIDADNDGWEAADDCDDDDARVNPGESEVCDDGVDNDCDDLVDAEDVDCQG